MPSRRNNRLPRMRFLERSAATLVVGLSLASLAAVAATQGSSQAQAPEPRATPAPDPLFAQPYIDIDEWRDRPVRHRYVHGGFKGTETRFSFYFPPKEQYQGRFFQHITPVPDNENLAQKVASPASTTRSASPSPAAPTSSRPTAAASSTSARLPAMKPIRRSPPIAPTRQRRILPRGRATKMYGGKRPYGYAYGGSGRRRIARSARSRTPRGVWDGAVPFVIGSTMAIPNMFTVRMQAMRVLRDKFPQIVDAVEPGGSGDPYAGLNDEEAEALREVTRMGFPTQSWFGYKTMGMHGFAALYQGVVDGRSRPISPISGPSPAISASTIPSASQARASSSRARSRGRSPQPRPRG